jgi:hypothetical protein
VKKNGKHEVISNQQRGLWLYARGKIDIKELILEHTARNSKIMQ